MLVTMTACRRFVKSVAENRKICSGSCSAANRKPLLIPFPVVVALQRDLCHASPSDPKTAIASSNVPWRGD